MRPTTKVIVRIDDVCQGNIRDIVRWTLSKHPDIPLSCFLYKTDQEWDIAAWRGVKDMIVKYGWEVGGHTRNHPFLSTVSKEKISQEIEGNIEDIEKNLTKVGLSYKVKSFAYPYGDYDERVKDVLKAIDIPIGLTFPDGYPYESLGEKINPLEFGITCNGKLPAEVLNNKFTKVHDRKGIYCICLHVKVAKPYGGCIQKVLSAAKYKVEKNKLAKMCENLDRHFDFIKSHKGVEFTTFRSLLGNLL